MIIHWCLKGVAAARNFGDNEARLVLKTGVPSRWLWNNQAKSLAAGLELGQAVLGLKALDDHVNNYSSVPDTPYVSLSAGAVVPIPGGGVRVRPAWRTAVDFATGGGTSGGYVFRCWMNVSPKPNAGLFAISDEVRDLNIYRQFWIYHDEGEIAAPLLVPARQIEWVAKIEANLDLVPGFGINGYHVNPDFVPPDSVGNIVEVV